MSSERDKRNGDSSPPEWSAISNFEDVLAAIGAIGRWQAWIFICVAWIQFFQTLANFNVIIFTVDLEYRCSLPAVNGNWSFAETLSLVSPPLAGGKGPDPCRVRRLDYAALAKLPYAEAFAIVNGTAENETETCSSFVFSNATKAMGNTLRTDFHLVCEKSVLNRHSQMAFMAGLLLGSLAGGFLSDNFGRMATFTASSLIFAVLSLAQAFVTSFSLFTFIRLAMAAAYITSVMSSFTLVLEVCVAKYRARVSGLFFVPYAIGYASISAPTYLFKDWRTVQWTSTLPLFMAAAFPWLLPESPRWLLVKAKTSRAERTLTTAARLNRSTSTPSRDLLMGVTDDKTPSAFRQALAVLRIFRHPKLALRTGQMFWAWIVTAGVYFGSSLSASEFSANPFVANTLAGAVEVPAYLLCVPLLHWGRRRSLALAYLLAGLSFVISAYIKPLWLTSLIIGKLCITTAFGLIYVLTSELYPTPVRNAALSLCSFVSRFGALLAPYIAGIADDPSIGPEYAWVPVLVFAALSATAAALMFFLPETKGRLPDTFEDIDGGSVSGGKSLPLATLAEEEDDVLAPGELQTPLSPVSS